jgi:drug/metabolite transporter (DMT)-like permease
MDPLLFPTLACALALAAVHVLSPRELSLFPATPRSRWLSLAGGIAVAYVFMHLLPELSEHERTLQDGAEGAGLIVYGLALVGLVAFYGVERHLRRAFDR